MSRSPHTSRAAIAALSIGLTIAVFAVREASSSAADGLAVLYVLPVALVALEFGLVAGLAAAVGGVSLVVLWDLTAPGELSLLGYASRALLFAGSAALCARMAERLRRSARHGNQYFQMGEDMLCVVDPVGTLVRVNDRWHDILGWAPSELEGSAFIELVHAEDRERSIAQVGKLAREGGSVEHFTSRIAQRYGGYRTFEWSASFDTEEGLLYASGRDVTDRLRAERERALAEERFRAAFEDSAAGMLVVGLKGEEFGRIVQTNQAAAEILGVDPDSMIGAFTFSEYAHPDDIPQIADAMKALTAGEIPMVSTEVRIVRPGGEVRWVQVRASVIHDADGEPRYRLSQIFDIHELKANEEALQHMADHDQLSWLFNRRRFVADLEDELQASELRGSRGAVLVMDLDGFKEVNDRAGHAAGDEVIRSVATALQRRLRSGDVAGRLGGDEFGVMLRRVDPEQAVLVSHDLMRAIHLELAELDIEAAHDVRTSIGVVVVEGGAHTADELLAQADHAMYRAKKAGGGRVELAAGGDRSAMPS